MCHWAFIKEEIFFLVWNEKFFQIHSNLSQWKRFDTFFSPPQKQIQRVQRFYWHYLILHFKFWCELYTTCSHICPSRRCSFNLRLSNLLLNLSPLYFTRSIYKTVIFTYFHLAGLEFLSFLVFKYLKWFDFNLLSYMLHPYSFKFTFEYLLFVFLQVVSDFQRLQISLHAAGGLPRRRTVDFTARQVCVYMS